MISLKGEGTRLTIFSHNLLLGNMPWDKMFLKALLDGRLVTAGF